MKNLQKIKADISLENISKLFKIYHSPADVIYELISRKSYHKEFWALKNISFHVGQGDVVGIIGRNGAGKSTLLQIVSETLNATSGTLKVNGKVSAIMVMGTGFNVELTGRENILMGGLCLGMTHKEIKNKMDWIISFSGIQDFIDYPCKGYSSGMLARLAFSIAAAVEPNILIIDEALSVGDVAFAAKSYNHMRKIAKSGVTILFVSHSIQSIYELCNKAILLDHGKVLMIDKPHIVGEFYNKLIDSELKKQGYSTLPSNSNVSKSNYLNSKLPSRFLNHITSFNDYLKNGKSYIRKGNEKVTILRISASDQEGNEIRYMKQDETYVVCISILCWENVEQLSIGFLIKTTLGSIIDKMSSLNQNQIINGKTDNITHVAFSFTCRLAPNQYIFLPVVEAFPKKKLDQQDIVLSEALVINVDGQSIFNGIVDMKSKFIGYEEF